MAQGRITDKQKEILEFIKACILKKGYPPTVREICEKVQLKSTSSVHSHLEQLEKNGYIHRDPTKPRAIEIVDDTFNLSRRELVNVPLIGTVAAGAPILADENVENYFPIPAELLPNSETFMLKVRGNSMIDVGIYDGDRVIVEQTSVAENGEIVVALIDDSATVKRHEMVAAHVAVTQGRNTFSFQTDSRICLGSRFDLILYLAVHRLDADRTAECCFHEGDRHG